MGKALEFGKLIHELFIAPKKDVLPWDYEQSKSRLHRIGVDIAAKGGEATVITIDEVNKRLLEIPTAKPEKNILISYGNADFFGLTNLPGGTMVSMPDGSTTTVKELLATRLKIFKDIGT